MAVFGEEVSAGGSIRVSADGSLFGVARVAARTITGGEVGSKPQRRRVHSEPCRPRASRSRARAKAGRSLTDVDDASAVSAVVVIEVRQVRADWGEGCVDGAGRHGAAFQCAERGRPLIDWMNSGLTSGLSAPVSRCRRTCRRTASLRFTSARSRPITSTVTSHGPQSEQSSCTVAPQGRTDAVRPQKRQTAINESLTRLTRSPLLTAFGGAGRAALSLLKNLAIPEVHATRGSYSRRWGGVPAEHGALA